jgi:hypothetical protein
MTEDSNNSVIRYHVNIEYTETEHGKPLKYVQSVILQET